MVAKFSFVRNDNAVRSSYSHKSFICQQRRNFYTSRYINVRRFIRFLRLFNTAIIPLRDIILLDKCGRRNQTILLALFVNHVAEGGKNIFRELKKNALLILFRPSRNSVYLNSLNTLNFRLIMSLRCIILVSGKDNVRLYYLLVYCLI